MAVSNSWGDHYPSDDEGEIRILTLALLKEAILVDYQCNGPFHVCSGEVEQCNAMQSNRRMTLIAEITIS